MEKYYLNIDDIQGRKYIRIYTHIKNLIIEGEIKEHEKLPPIRKLSEYIGVNNTTIVKVYELLEKEGYVYKIVGSGTFASEIKKYRAKDKKKNKNIIQFDNGNPSNEMFPVEDCTYPLPPFLRKSFSLSVVKKIIHKQQTISRS